MVTRRLVSEEDALNKIDSTAVQVFRTLDHYQNDQANQPDVHGSEFELLSGEQLERWLLKLVWGGAVGGALSASKLRTGVDQNMLADYLFRDQKLPEGWGLGVAFQPGQGRRASGQIEITTGVGDDGTLWSAAVSMRVVTFNFGLGNQTANRGWEFQHRPQGIVLKSLLDHAGKALALGWDQKKPGKPVVYTYQRP